MAAIFKPELTLENDNNVSNGEHETVRLVIENDETDTSNGIVSTIHAKGNKHIRFNVGKECNSFRRIDLPLPSQRQLFSHVKICMCILLIMLFVFCFTIVCLVMVVVLKLNRV